MYVPNSRRNLISVSKLINNGFTVSFVNEVITERNNLFIYSGVETNGLYIELNNSVVIVPSKRKEPSSNLTIL